jgi:hypothetical protein
LAYYRYERIVEDIAVECQLIFSTAGDEDRERELRFMRSNFEPGGVPFPPKHPVKPKEGPMRCLFCHKLKKI